MRICAPMAQEAKIAAIGPIGEVGGLGSVGIEVVPLESSRELVDLLRQKALEPGIRLVLVSESVADGSRQTVDELRRRGGAVPDVRTGGGRGDDVHAPYYRAIRPRRLLPLSTPEHPVPSDCRRAVTSTNGARGRRPGW